MLRVGAHSQQSRILSALCHRNDTIGVPPDGSEHKKTSEMNELETDKIPFQIWAHDFEKQKS
mgnify:CR=1 FL=1